MTERVQPDTTPTAIPVEAVTDEATVFDLQDPELLRTPHAIYGRLREQAPVVWAKTRVGETDLGFWLVTRYAEVKELLADSRFSNDPHDVPGGQAVDFRRKAREEIGMREEESYLTRTLLDIEGADHTRLRKLVSRTFTVRRVNELRPRVEEITDRLLDELPATAENGVVDLIEHFAYPLPIAVICELVGIPEEDRTQWHVWSDKLLSTDRSLVAGVVREAAAQIRRLIELRRAQPTSDLLSGLVRIQDEDGDRLTEDEMISLIFVLVIAGHLTTANLIGNGTVALLTHPDELDRLKSDPELAPRAVHELMRWCGPLMTAARVRYALEDVEIGGTTIRQGESAMGLLATANRDLREFDAPDRLDITREPAGRRESHVGFGHGPHYCLGAALARQEGDVAFTKLFSRFPDLRLAVDPEELEYQPQPTFRSLIRLPVRL